MRHCIHLVEALGLGGILFMAAPAKVGDIGQLRYISGGIVSVLGQCSMTRFAGDIGMLAAAMHLALLIVALEALLMPGIGDGTSADRFEGTRPIVSVFPEVSRHYDNSNEQKHP